MNAATLATATEPQETKRVAVVLSPRCPDCGGRALQTGTPRLLAGHHTTPATPTTETT